MDASGRDDAVTANQARKTAQPAMTPVSVVVPVRNAADWIVDCLAAIRSSGPAEVILVDGRSEDGTVLLAEPLVDRVIRDDGRGPGAARNLGVDAAGQPWIAFIDADIILPDGALPALVQEATERGLTAIQAGLHSSGADYWSEQLAWQHNHGRSRSWFGVSATVIQAAVARDLPFDERFRSGEDVDLRLRLESRGLSVGISRSVVARHRFAPSLAQARRQWLDDGAGLGRLVRKHGPRALSHLAIPFAAAAYWAIRSLAAPRRLPYVAGFLVGNWRGAVDGLLDRRVPLSDWRSSVATAVGLGALWFGAGVLGLFGVGLLTVVAVLVPSIPRMLLDSALLPILAGLAVAAMVGLEVAATMPPGSRWRLFAERYRSRAYVFVALTVLATGLRLGANLRLLG